MQTFETVGGKTIQMKIKPGTAHIKLEFATGGELPVDLSGVFTDEKSASQAVARYLAKDKKQPKSTKE